MVLIFRKIFYVSFEKYLLGDILRFWENVYSFVVIRYKILHIWPLLASIDLATMTALSHTTIKRFAVRLSFTLELTDIRTGKSKQETVDTRCGCGYLQIFMTDFGLGNLPTAACPMVWLAQVTWGMENMGSM